MSKAKRSSVRRIVKIPKEYLEAVELGKILFPFLFQLENGLRLAIHRHQTMAYGEDWWEISLKPRLPTIFDYAANQQKRHDAMPWIGASSRVKVLPIHLVTLDIWRRS